MLLTICAECGHVVGDWPFDPTTSYNTEKHESDSDNYEIPMSSKKFQHDVFPTISIVNSSPISTSHWYDISKLSVEPVFSGTIPTPNISMSIQHIDNHCKYIIKGGTYIGSNCCARIPTGNYCVFHQSVLERDKPSPTIYLSWIHYVRPKQEHSLYIYKDFPKKEYDGYYQWLDECNIEDEDED
jgi:hypothetical protein